METNNAEENHNLSPKQIEEETERLYDLWLEDNHPEEWRLRSERRDYERSVLEDVARTYRRPIFDPFTELDPPLGVIRDTIKELDNKAAGFVREKQACKGDVDKTIFVLPLLNRQHDMVLNRLKQLRYRLAERERTGSWDIDTKGGITREDVERAKSVPILSFISDHSKRSGKRHYTRCPFHNEKTASFVIYEDQNTYHCYGCGENGDVISFVQKTKNLEFIEAVKLLINR